MTPEKQKQYRLRRLMAALHKLGYISIQEAAATVDKGKLEAIPGVGKVLGKVMKEELQKGQEGDAVQ